MNKASRKEADSCRPNQILKACRACGKAHTKNAFTISQLHSSPFNRRCKGSMKELVLCTHMSLTWDMFCKFFVDSHLTRIQHLDQTRYSSTAKLELQAFWSKAKVCGCFDRPVDDNFGLSRYTTFMNNQTKFQFSVSRYIPRASVWDFTLQRPVKLPKAKGSPDANTIEIPARTVEQIAKASRKYLPAPVESAAGLAERKGGLRREKTTLYVSKTLHFLRSIQHLGFYFCPHITPFHPPFATIFAQKVATDDNRVGSDFRCQSCRTGFMLLYASVGARTDVLAISTCRRLGSGDSAMEADWLMNIWDLADTPTYQTKHMQANGTSAIEALGEDSVETKVTSPLLQKKARSMKTAYSSWFASRRPLWTKRANYDQILPYRESELFKAAAEGDVQTMRTLFDRGDTQPLEHGEVAKALCAAAFKGCESVIELLIDKDVDLNAQEYDGSNALCAASVRGHINIVLRMLDNGADMNIRGRERTTPLISAFGANHWNIVPLLLQRGADVNAMSNIGEHLIIRAIFSSSHQMLRLLLEAGADPNAKKRCGYPAMNLAASRLDGTAIDLLIEYGGDININGSVCTATPQVDAVNMLLQKGADPNILGRHVYPRFVTALEKAKEYRDHQEIVEILLKYGAKTCRYGLFAP